MYSYLDIYIHEGIFRKTRNNKMETCLWSCTWLNKRGRKQVIPTFVRSLLTKISTCDFIEGATETVSW